MLPVRTGDIAPPSKMIIQTDGLRGRGEDYRPGYKILRRRAGIVLRLGDPFCNRHIAGRLDESFELLIGDFSLIDEEPVHRHAMHWLSIAKHRRVASHPEFPAVNPHHVLGNGTWWRGVHSVMPGCRPDAHHKHEDSRSNHESSILLA